MFQPMRWMRVSCWLYSACASIAQTLYPQVAAFRFSKVSGKYLLIDQGVHIAKYNPIGYPSCKANQWLQSCAHTEVSRPACQSFHLSKSCITTHQRIQWKSREHWTSSAFVKKNTKWTKEDAPMFICSPNMPGRSPGTCPCHTRFDPYTSERPHHKG